MSQIQIKDEDLKNLFFIISNFILLHEDDKKTYKKELKLCDDLYLKITRILSNKN